MKIKQRAAVAAAAVGVAAAAATVGGGTAAAAPIPKLGFLGDEIWTTGDHAGCRGKIHVGLTSKPGHRGVVTVTLTSRGFTGTGPGWAKDPVCRGEVRTTWYTLAKAPFYKSAYTKFAFGPKPGAQVREDVRVGSGLNLLAETVAPGPSKGVSHYVIVP